MITQATNLADGSDPFNSLKRSFITSESYANNPHVVNV